MDVLFLISVFRLYPGLKLTFEHNSVRKNLFLSACFCWDSKLSFCEMDREFAFGGLIGYGNFCLDSIFRYSKVFRLHASLHDAAGAVRTHSGKGPGYCYMIGRDPNSCLLGHVTGLLFCLCIKLKIFLLFSGKLFLLSIFNSVDFRSSMSCIVLDFELADKNVIQELGVFLTVPYKGFHFVLQRLLNLINRLHGTQVIYMELRGVVKSWIMISSLLSFTA